MTFMFFGHYFVEVGFYGCFKQNHMIIIITLVINHFPNIQRGKYQSSW